ncbi:zinc ribbon domain-containing protein [Xanthobacter sp. V13C-7B]|uniref:zinc ribbon domain-containing protein n=1 Tax=Xanthobacter variabilis TaxID=3119932 RepID=UPI00372C1115
MNTKHDFCPGCGAQVYPEEAQCPFCGRSLRSSFLTPVIVGLGGTALALISGALVWWVLSSPAPQGADTRPAAPQASAPAPEAAPAPVASAPAAAEPAAPALVPPPAPVVAPAAPATPPRMALPEPAPSATTPPPSAFAPPPSGFDATSRPSVAVTPLSASPAPEEGPVGDAESRRAFAKSKQDSFAQNGLDLQVSTSGPDETILTIKFNFSAKTAAELIVAGPFPKQCQQRGFTEILFQDPTGATWSYDIATQKMSVK